MVVAITVAAYALAQWGTVVDTNNSKTHSPANLEPLPPLDARDVGGGREIAKSELLILMAKSRPLSESEKTQVDRGCPGLTCLYQGLGITRWPELARGTRAYLRLEDALNRSCPEGTENFVFVKQAWWTSGKPPVPNKT